MRLIRVKMREQAPQIGEDLQDGIHAQYASYVLRVFIQSLVFTANRYYLRRKKT